jgi:hypothetical protein
MDFNEATETVGAVNRVTRGEAAQTSVEMGDQIAAVTATRPLFEMTWRAKWLADGSKTVEQMAEMLEAQATYLRELAAAGVELADEVDDDYASLTTTDPDVAAKYEFHTVEDEDEEGNVTLASVGPVDKLGSGLAADLAAAWAVDGKIGILGHAESIEFVRPDVAEQLMHARNAFPTTALVEPAS